VRISTSGSAGQSFGAFCNDGMALTHTGTCNDGVGKSACGGVITVRSPGGGSEEAGGNVLVGNFALFGATGGRLFVEGQAGDRFAVRNSGSTAVVEGVGDFCCEYMTNGAVLNLGTFGKGFGNGMSGGFVYQYDPYGDLPKKMSHDSILLGTIGDETDAMAAVHADAIRLMLEWHLAATGSEKARWLIENWESERHQFVYGLPRALLLYQDSDAILKAKSRKDLVEELSTALAAHQVRKFKLAYRDRKAVLNGTVPGYGETDTEGMFVLLNNYTVLSMAQSLALSRVPGARGPSDPAVEKAVRNLLLTEDFALMQRLARYARDAIADYDDEALAVMVASKRLDDYRQALKGRNTRSIDSPGTYGWILHQTARNVDRIGRIPSFEELFARQVISGFAPARQ
jgi:glutamate synthase (NADPH/NADH) large chain